MPSETREGWLGEKLVECRHSDYGYTIVEWILMITVIVLSVVICLAAYYKRVYTDGYYQLELLADTLPSVEMVKRYNRYKDSDEDDKVQNTQPSIRSQDK
ncbi:hypothetical protein V3C99_014703 [Haemonchus contortus]|uniref:Prepilin-type N-terminal cleavage/methylation domain-containing protein n=1 Tax=Haemonchus contortus TaxID=6289 RepID=A0A7I4YVR7_HAECO